MNDFKTDATREFVKMGKDPLNRDKQRFYIVDYDIPRKPQSRRRAFYRRLSRLKRQMGLFGKMSTMSVVITADPVMATQIYNLAKKYGKANLYSGFSKRDARA